MSLHRLSAGGGYEYLLRHTACGDVERAADTSLTAYYTAAGYPAGRWLGSGLAGLARGAGLAAGSPVSEEGMARLYGTGCDPVTGAELGNRYRVYKTYGERVAARIAALPAGLDEPVRADAAARVEAEEAARRTPVAVAGFDLTFTAPKSVSVLWALADPAVQERLVAAHRAAVDDTLTLLERHALFTRVGRSGAAQVATRGAVAAAFDHWDTRTGDPNLHTHVVLANKVQGPDGRWRSIDSKALHAAVVALSEVYDTLLADRVTTVAGVGWEERDRGPRRSPALEIVGVPDRLLHAFSFRSGQIATALQAQVADFTRRHGRTPGRAEVLRLRQQATRQTRPGKTVHALPYLLTRWREHAGRVLGPSAVVSLGVNLARCAPPLLTSDVGADVVGACAVATVAGVQARRSTWTRWNLLAEAARATRSLRLASTDDRLSLLARVVDTAVQQCLALEVPALVDPPTQFRRPDGESAFARHWEDVYTSAALLDAEARLLAAAADIGGPRALPVTLSGPRAEAADLAEDQVAAVVAIATSGRRVDVLVGPAGAGKTTTLRSLRTTWEATYGPGSVLGLAPSAAAARELAGALGIPCETTAKWRQDLQHHEALWSGRVGHLMIVDEASLAGTFDLDDVVTRAGAAGGKVVLVGDHAQLAAVEAGGAFGLLARDTGAAELTSLWRFRFRWEAEASRALRRGDSACLDAYAARDRLHDGAAEAMIESAYQTWCAARRSGASALLVAADNATVAALNARARADRIASGQVGPAGVALCDGTVAGVGDVVVTRHNDRRLRIKGADTAGTSGRRGYVRNGDLWIVVDRHPDGALTVGPGGAARGQVLLPADYVRDHVELGYATTAHRAQGLTVDAAFALLRPGMSRETTYVALTRGRTANHAFVATDLPDPECDSFDPTEQSGRQVLEAILARTGAETSATETLRRRQSHAGSLAHLVPIHETLAQAAQQSRWAPLVHDQLQGGLAPRVLDSFAYGPLVAALRRGERDGHDMATVLTRLLHALKNEPAQDGHDAVRDPAALLHAQLTDWLGNLPPPTRPAAPLLAGLFLTAEWLPPSLADSELGRSLADVQDLIQARVEALVAGALAHAPAWAQPLGPPPRDPNARASWMRHLATVAAYRDHYDLADGDPLLPRDENDDPAGGAWRRAVAASAAASRLARESRQGTSRSHRQSHHPLLERPMSR